MALYLMGDIQGCNDALQRMLQKIDFSPSRDTLYVLGDMVNRGEDSAGVIETLMGFGDCVKCVLGNHELHLLAVGHGIRPADASDTLQSILDKGCASSVLTWLRHQKLAISFAHSQRRWLLVHAGVLPQWSVDQTLRLAGEVEAALQSSHFVRFLQQMYGNQPSQWSNDLKGAARLRVIVNALTRLRLCDESGVMAFAAKDNASKVGPSNVAEAVFAPAKTMPWFDVPNRKTALEDISIAFGHWSALGLVARPSLKHPSLLGLDTGCVWGRELTCYELGTGIAHAVTSRA